MQDPGELLPERQPARRPDATAAGVDQPDGQRPALRGAELEGGYASLGAWDSMPVERPPRPRKDVSEPRAEDEQRLFQKQGELRLSLFHRGHFRVADALDHPDVLVAVAVVAIVRTLGPARAALLERLKGLDFDLSDHGGHGFLLPPSAGRTPASEGPSLQSFPDPPCVTDRPFRGTADPGRGISMLARRHLLVTRILEPSKGRGGAGRPRLKTVRPHREGS